MKKFAVILTVSLVYLACKKESFPNPASFEEKTTVETRSYLKNQMPEKDFDQLDWSNVTEGKLSNNRFVVILKDKTDPFKYVIAARSEHGWAANHISIQSDLIGKTSKIVKQNLQKTTTKSIIVVNGKAEKTSGLIMPSTNSLKVKTLLSETGLPDVTVSAVRYLSTPIDLMSLYWLLDQNINYWNIYVDMGNTNGSQYLLESNDIAYEIEFDDSMDQQTVDIFKLMNCFGDVPSSGATYSATLSADIPINGKPNRWLSGGNPGHTFLTLTKTNGSVSVTQVFGFYPSYGPKSLIADPVPQAIKDDSNHEADASITMPNISSSDFNAMAARAMILSSQQYDLNDFNCTTFAVDVFNMARPENEIAVSNNPLFGGKMPGGLFNALNVLKNNNGPEAANINMNKTNAPTGKGQCP